MWYSKVKYCLIPSDALDIDTMGSNKIGFIAYKKHRITQKKKIVGVQIEGMKLNNFSILMNQQKNKIIPKQIAVCTKRQFIGIIF